MNLDEITMVSDQQSKGFDLSDIDLSTGAQIGTAENIPVWKYFTTNKQQLAYALKINNDIVASIVGTPQKLDKPYFNVQRTWTNPAHRGKGYAPALYAALVRKFHIALISDKEQSLGGKRIWDKLKTMVTVRVFDSETRKFVDNVSDADVYASDRYYLIAEHEEVFGNDVWLEQNGTYVDDTLFEWYSPSILRDYVIFTEAVE